ncbi:hypothetical protein GZL_07599 [Streptomyces sp. 769]|nr:hypothetical protein GZL_07599 [Streptomyces sp. 769]
MNTALGAVSATFMSLTLVALAHPNATIRARAERLLRLLFRAR